MPKLSDVHGTTKEYRDGQPDLQTQQRADQRHNVNKHVIKLKQSPSLSRKQLATSEHQRQSAISKKSGKGDTVTERDKHEDPLSIISDTMRFDAHIMHSMYQSQGGKSNIAPRGSLMPKKSLREET